MPSREKALPGQLYTDLAVVVGTLCGPRLTTAQTVAILAWLAPDWGRKLLRLAAAYRRFRAGRDPDKRD
jgi:hypothetical protein